MKNDYCELINIHNEEEGTIEHLCESCDESFFTHLDLGAEENHDIPIKCNRCIKIESQTGSWIKSD